MACALVPFCSFQDLDAARDFLCSQLRQGLMGAELQDIYRASSYGRLLWCVHNCEGGHCTGNVGLFTVPVTKISSLYFTCAVSFAIAYHTSRLYFHTIIGGMETTGCWVWWCY
uniref:Uncharacterized protein n=1 Tax=Varanus komodoensis TaxID=61221 RepID=A0A8D2Q702_VARKO